MNKPSYLEDKFDIFTKEPIPYKSRDFYLYNLYAKKTNLINHFKILNNSEREQIIKELLKLRIQHKKIKYGLSTVEARSLIFPSPALLKKLDIDYNKLLIESNLQTKYDYYQIINTNLTNISKEIIVDTREQKPLKFPSKIKINNEGLKFGDYALSTNLENSICIERKSLSDFIGTMSQGFERFCRELVKAQDKNCKVLMVVEKNINESLSFNYLKECRYTKATSEFIFSRLRELIQMFPHFQVLFVNGRMESAKITWFMLNYGPNIFQTDIQYLYDSKQLKNIL